MAMRRIREWCDRVDLGIHPGKIVSILFTKHRKYNFIPLRLEGKEIELQSETRHLGITLDSKLNWSSHCRSKATRGSMAVAQCRRALGKKWGLTPKICMWIYTAVIRPTITYGSVAWITAVNLRKNRGILEKPHRLALLGALGGMRSTPTEGMECLTGIKPIDLHLLEVALVTQARLNRHGDWLDWRGFGRLKMKTTADFLHSFNRNIEVFNVPCEKSTRILPAKRNFNVKIRSRKDWEENGLLKVPNWTLSCFTDGSKIDGNAGASYFIPEIEEDIMIPLGRYPTVYQAETLGIIYAARDLEQNETDHFDRVDLYVDSLSTLQTLCSTNPVTDLVLECFLALIHTLI